MKALIYAGALISIMCLSGCREKANVAKNNEPQQKGPVTDTQTSEKTAETQALDSFKQIISFLSGLTNFDGSSLYTNFSYDVKKTDSLVSPFVGVIVFNENPASAFSNTQAKSVFTYTCRFVEQDGKWVSKSVDGEQQLTEIGKDNATKQMAEALDDESRSAVATKTSTFLQFQTDIHKKSLDSLDELLAVFLGCEPVRNTKTDFQNP